MNINILSEINYWLPNSVLKRYKNPLSKYSNWIIPKEVLCGPYPYYDGVNFLTKEEGAKNMKDILDDGVTVFISLQTSDDFKNPNYFKMFSEDMLYTRYLEEKHRNVTFKSFPIYDGNAISIEYMVDIIKFILLSLSNMQKVYIHCTGGHGRTGMVAACLIKTVFSELSMNDILPIVQNFHDRRLRKDERTKEFNYDVKSPNTNTQICMCNEYDRLFSKMIYPLFNFNTKK